MDRRHGDLPLLSQGHQPRGGPQRAGRGRLSLGLAPARRAPRPRPRLHYQIRRRPLGGDAARGGAGGMARSRAAVERRRGRREADRRPALARGRVRHSPRDEPGRWDRAGPGLRAARVRRPRHGRRSQCALGHRRRRPRQASRPRHADHARGRRRGVRQEGPRLEPHRAR